MRDFLISCFFLLFLADVAGAGKCRVPEAKKEKILHELCYSGHLYSGDEKRIQCPKGVYSRHGWEGLAYVYIAAAKICGLKEAQALEDALEKEGEVLESLSVCLPQKLPYKKIIQKNKNFIMKGMKNRQCDSKLHDDSSETIEDLALGIKDLTKDLHIDPKSRVEEDLEIEITSSGDIIDRKE